MNCNRIEDKDIIIWGAGNYGRLAYFYYKEKCNILCYVDIDKNKWGQSLNGILICNPNVIEEKEACVVIALKYGIDEVKSILRLKYKKEQIRIWSIMESVIDIKDYDLDMNTVNKDSFVVYMCGGLGNQMFQYAFLRYLQYLGKKVVADVSSYSGFGVMPFALSRAFKNVKLDICSDTQTKQIIIQNVNTQENLDSKFLIYSEPFEHDVINSNYDKFFEVFQGGIIKGYHQHRYYPECIRNILLEEFKFDVKEGSKLHCISKQIVKLNAVGVHIRRGDYLTQSSKQIYGNICTQEYYKRALKYICNKEKNITIVFFSDDIEWVKCEFGVDNAIYIEESMFDDYQDWYDMYLMSICKHNIIANSTFSWWGAWLNNNQNKIVIAPDKWINGEDTPDIWCEGWIKMGGNN